MSVIMVCGQVRMSMLLASEEAEELAAAEQQMAETQLSTTEVVPPTASVAPAVVKDGRSKTSRRTSATHQHPLRQDPHKRHSTDSIRVVNEVANQVIHVLHASVLSSCSLLFLYPSAPIILIPHVFHLST